MDGTTNPVTTTDDTAQLNRECLGFVTALMSPTLSDRDVAWAGITAMFTLSRMTPAITPDAVRKAFERLNKIARQ